MKRKPSRPRKSDVTKATILKAAKEHFSAYGYAAATIRGIAASAKIDPTMVMRYYGNKEKLFAAAAEFDLRLPNLAVLPREKVGYALVEHFLNRWEGDEALMVLLRSAVTHKIAAERMRKIFATQVTVMVAAIRGETRPVAAKRAGLLVTQMLGLALCRYVLKIPPVVDLKRDELIRRVGRNVQAYLLDD
jgi:AcrR family transcriptional regulator